MIIKQVAVYLRLSLDDDALGESGSIKSQRRIVMDYIKSDPDIAELPVIEFVDDGYSGTSFERPGVTKLLKAAARGEVCCVVVKDLSRFGRQYLKVGKYLEQVFPRLGVRFISVNDHYDSSSHTGSTAELDVPVRNLINAMYSRDISKKVRSAARTRIAQGCFTGAYAIFGYKKDECDKSRLIIDDDAAEIVRRIFKLAHDGISGARIAAILNTGGIATPSEYKKQNGIVRKWNTISGAVPFWTGASVARILRDERYTGAFIGGMRERGKLGSRESFTKPKETWTRIPLINPPIITEETFNAVAELRASKTGTKPRNNSTRIFYRKVRCANCGRIMRRRSDTAHPYYHCDTARYFDKYGCTGEKLQEGELSDIITAVLEIQLAVLCDLGIQRLPGKKNAEAFTFRTPCCEMEKKKLQRDKLTLYERFKDGAIDKTEYLKAREAMACIPEKTAIQKPQDLSCGDTAADILTPAIINALLGQITVHSGKHLEIALSFTGLPSLNPYSIV